MNLWKIRFRRENFTSSSLVPPKKCHAPQFSGKKLLRISTSFLPWKFPTIRYFTYRLSKESLVSTAVCHGNWKRKKLPGNEARFYVVLMSYLQTCCAVSADGNYFLGGSSGSASNGSELNVRYLTTKIRKILCRPAHISPPQKRVRDGLAWWTKCRIVLNSLLSLLLLVIDPGHSWYILLL